ncbi:MAG: helix-turn-helix transcriptional regulator [Halanaerobiales bacterium]|nr:helix-turn-helix transcriptional regulator [Halanaerobiales bacterium]
MAKAFSDNEKKIIKNAIIEKGRELFGKYGFKKTAIGDLTKSTGISQGSFYSFFNSKEELYFEILEIEEQVIREKLLSEIIRKIFE